MFTLNYIGSTFLKLGEKEPYYNNMIVLDKCDKTPEVPNSEIIWKKKEKNVLLEWAKLIKKEDMISPTYYLTQNHKKKHSIERRSG